MCVVSNCFRRVPYFRNRKFDLRCVQKVNILNVKRKFISMVSFLLNFARCLCCFCPAKLIRRKHSLSEFVSSRKPLKGYWGIELWLFLIFLKSAVEPLSKWGVCFSVRNVHICNHVRSVCDLSKKLRYLSLSNHWHMAVKFLRPSYLTASVTAQPFISIRNLFSSWTYMEYVPQNIQQRTINQSSLIFLSLISLNNMFFLVLFTHLLLIVRLVNM